MLSGPWVSHPVSSPALTGISWGAHKNADLGPHPTADGGFAFSPSFQITQVVLVSRDHTLRAPVLCQCFRGGSVIKRPTAMQETWVRSLGLEDPLEEEMTTNSSILARKTPRTEEHGVYSPWGLI